MAELTPPSGCTLTGAIRVMAGHALVRYLGQSSDRPLHVSIYRSLPCNDRKLTGSVVHAGAYRLHLLWHVGRHVGGTMRGER